MYLTKEQIEKTILETFDKVVFYNGKRLDEVLGVNERLLLVTSISNALPSPLPDLIDEYHKVRKLKENISVENVYYHLLEEVIKLGEQLHISFTDMYMGFTSRFRKVQTEELENKTKETLINELADVATIVGSIADYVDMGELLYDAILIVNESNNTKLCTLDQVKETIKEKGLSNNPNIRTHDLGNDQYLIVDEELGKSIKPVSFKKANFKHLFK